MDLSKYYDDLPIGKENAVTKEYLSYRWGVTERAARRIIQELRATDYGDNFVIISTSTGKGYYRTSDIKEIEAFKKEVTNRAKNTFTPLKKVNRILAHAGQLELVNNLQYIRKAKGISNTQAVNYVRQYDPTFDKSILSKIENGRCGPTNQQLAALAELYDSTPEELTGLTLA